MNSQPTDTRHATGGAERIPSLDGLRAISIGLVLVGHVAGTMGAPAILSSIYNSIWINLAELGVRIFFVISGFLITSLLLEEHARYGRISLGRFFLRRTFRIFPAFLVYLLALWIAQLAGRFSFTPSDWLHALTYTMNYHSTRTWEIGHLWSLSVEEQFYAIWPALLILAGIRRGMLCAVAMLVIAPILRIAYLRYFPGTQPYLTTAFETTADALAIGCVLAWKRDHLWADERWRRLLSTWWIVPGLLIVSYVLHARTQSTFLLGHAALNIAIAVYIERSTRLPDRSVARWLNTRPFIFVGLVSYSLYLWQQPFLNRLSTLEFNRFPVNLLLAFALAVLSYHLVERPALRLRQRIERKLPARDRLPRSCAAGDSA